VSTRLDRLIARVVDGTHEIRAPRPALFEDAVTDSDVLPAEIDDETIAPLAIRPVPNAAARPLVEPPPAGPRREVPPSMRMETPRVEDRPASPALALHEARRPAPARPEAAPRQTGVSPMSDSIPPHVPVPHEGRHVEHTPRTAVPPTSTFRAPAMPPPASETRASRPHATRPVDVPAVEPDRITIEIGRIDVGGPARGPERMLTLDAYRATRRGGSR
jgi:hypothetical protein